MTQWKELIALLKSIDARLERLEKAVVPPTVTMLPGSMIYTRK